MQAMIQEFVDERFGRVRVLEEGDGTVLFCGADVARALGYRNTRSAIKRHCRYGVKRTVPHPQNPRRLLDMFFLPEGDLYRLIIGSKLPSAVAFEKWVFDVLLPGLRAAGGYTVRRPEISALLFEKERQVQALTAQLAERKDLELFASQLMRAGGGISMLRMARLLQDAGVRTGRTRMMAWMRRQGYLCRSNKEDNSPTQRGMALGLFVVEESLYAPRPGVVLLNQTTRVTPKGQQHFLKVFPRELD